MNSLMKVFSKSSAQYFVLLLVSLVCYAPLILRDKIVSPDSLHILTSLNQFHSLTEYLSGLLDFMTLDFQPIRDLSLWVDMIIFDFTGFNTFILTNVILWATSCFILLKIIKHYLPQRTDLAFFIVLLFTVYPLFSASVAWAMARKHILSFCFILLATNESLKTRPASWKLITFYLLSILSQPISLLWPLWYVTHTYLYGGVRGIRKMTSAVMGVLLVAVGTLNYFYYNLSPVYHETYSVKAGGFFNLIDRILATGHYFFQLISPYNLAFQHTPGSLESGIGIFLLLIFVAIIWTKRRDQRALISWSAFSFLPIVIVSTDANLLSDTYLLIPASGFIVLILTQLQSFEFPRRGAWAVLALLLSWGAMTFRNSINWTSPYKFAEVNFEAAQNCSSALMFARYNFLTKEKIPPSLRETLALNGCLQGSVYTYSNFTLNEYLTVLTFMIYYDENVSKEDKVESLKGLLRRHFLAAFALAAIEVERGNFDEAGRLIQEVKKNTTQTIRRNYIPFVAKILLPFCENYKQYECEEFLTNFSGEADGPFF